MSLGKWSQQFLENNPDQLEQFYNLNTRLKDQQIYRTYSLC